MHVQVRMRAKNVIKGLVPWADARRTLATRLRRKLAEEGVRAHIASADPSIPRRHALELLQEWYEQSPQSPGAHGSDSCMLGMHDSVLERSPTAAPASPLACMDDAAQSEGTKNSNGSGATRKPCFRFTFVWAVPKDCFQCKCMQGMQVRSTSS